MLNDKGIDSGTDVQLFEIDLIIVDQHVFVNIQIEALCRL
jgi:hypothetical protein